MLKLIFSYSMQNTLSYATLWLACVDEENVCFEPEGETASENCLDNASLRYLLYKIKSSPCLLSLDSWRERYIIFYQKSVFIFSSFY